MANLTPKLLYIGNASSGNVYTVANVVGDYTIIKSINICNTSNIPERCTIHILVNGAEAGTGNRVISNAEVLSNNVLYYNTSIVVPANSSVYVSQANTNLTFTLSGVEYA